MDKAAHDIPSSAMLPLSLKLPDKPGSFSECDIDLSGFHFLFRSGSQTLNMEEVDEVLKTLTQPLANDSLSHIKQCLDQFSDTARHHLQTIQDDVKGKFVHVSSFLFRFQEHTVF